MADSTITALGTITSPVAGDELAIWDASETTTKKIDWTNVINAVLNPQTGTTYPIVAVDAGKMITMSNAAANTATLPANASVPFVLGTEIHFMQIGAGQTTIAITTDTLDVEVSLTLKLTGQYAVATAKKITATQWVLFGNLEAA